MKFTTLTATAVALVMSAGAGFAACEDGEMVIKFAHVTNADNHPKGIAANLFAQRVNDEMNGKACMEVFPNSTLYDDDQVLEAMLQGDVQFAAPSLSKFETFTKQFRIFDLPFMFKNVEAVDAFQASEAGQAMKDSMTRRGLQGLEFWHNGMKQFSANKPLMLPTDAEGLKFRVQTSDVAVAMMTTDTRPKLAAATVPTAEGGEARIVGVAKGVGMIEPDMATMLAFVLTDAELAPADLDDAAVRKLVAFLQALTDPGARDRSDLIPDAVPSGLPPQPPAADRR